MECFGARFGCCVLLINDVSILLIVCLLWLCFEFFGCILLYDELGLFLYDFLVDGYGGSWVKVTFLPSRFFSTTFLFMLVYADVNVATFFFRALFGNKGRVFLKPKSL